MEKKLIKNIKALTKMQKPVDLILSDNEITRIAKGTTIKGDIITTTDIRIDGSVTGTIYSEGKVVVGETAVLSGKLLCSYLDFWGKMQGDIFTKEALSLKSTASVAGSINVNRIQVEMGTQINGSCHIIADTDYAKAASGILAEYPDFKQSGKK